MLLFAIDGAPEATQLDAFLVTRATKMLRIMATSLLHFPDMELQHILSAMISVYISNCLAHATAEDLTATLRSVIDGLPEMARLAAEEESEDAAMKKALGELNPKKMGQA